MTRPPRIVVLDSRCANPGDLSWAPLAALGRCTVHERTPPEAVAERARDAELVLVNKVQLGAETIAELPALRYVGVLATGVNVVDLAAAEARGIVVSNVPAYSTPSVAQHTFALLLALANRVELHSAGVHAGRWCRSPDFSYWETPQLELAELALGVVGFGQIGQSVARIAQAFGMRLLLHTRTPPSALPPGADAVSLDELFARSDVVSLHCPLTDRTARLVDARRLALMKPTALLLNTGRGGLVDEAALAEALRAGRLAGAGLDVLSSEPPAAGNPLLGAPNCLVTPHVAWTTRAARQRLLDVAVDNVRAFLAGTPRNRCRP